MRAHRMVMGLVLLMACGDSPDVSESTTRRDTFTAQDKAANPVPLGAAGQAASSAEIAAASPAAKRPVVTSSDPASRLIIRTGQASIEVDS
ncbi:MAG TPA: hypothetical protein VHH32_05585, partial [Gemmatimonadales bacterium]|nr:hypothetical protein [Gemmatimonadales bacterium]